MILIDIFCRFPLLFILRKIFQSYSSNYSCNFGLVAVCSVHNWLIMSEKLSILNPQWPLHVNSRENPAAANSAFCCYFPCYWEFRLLLSKPCDWLLIKTLEAASSLTDRNAIQGQSRNTLSDLTYSIETSKSPSDDFYTSFGWILKLKVG